MIYVCNQLKRTGNAAFLRNRKAAEVEVINNKQCMNMDKSIDDMQFYTGLACNCNVAIPRRKESVKQRVIWENVFQVLGIIKSLIQGFSSI